MDLVSLLTLFGALSSVLANLFKVLRTARATERGARSSDDLRAKLQGASTAFREALDATEEVTKNLAEKATALEEVQKRLKHYETLAATEKEKVAALLAEIEATSAKTSNAERWKNFRLGLLGNALFFVVGAVFSDRVLYWWNWIWPP